IGPLIDSPTFENTLLVITFDEACATGRDGDSRFTPKDRRHDGGGHVATVLVSRRIKPGTRSDELYHHESVLRTALEALGIHEYPGRALHATPMSAFFVQRQGANGK